MSNSRLAETLKENRSESITRRPTGPNSIDPTGLASRTTGLANLPGASMIPIDRIMNDPDQPRKDFDQGALQELADSLRDRGQLQPIRVRWNESAGKYVVVVGERRWRAADMAGMKSLACIISQGNASPEDLLEDQLVENALRQDLKPVEQARAYKALMEAKGFSLRDLANRLHIHFTSIQKTLALLGLAEPIQKAVDEGRLAASTAQDIGANIDDPATQEALANEFMQQGTSREEAKAAVRKAASKPASGKGRGVSKSKPKAAKEWKRKDPSSGLMVTITSRKAIPPGVVVEALRAVLQIAEQEEQPNS